MKSSTALLLPDLSDHPLLPLSLVRVTSDLCQRCTLLLRPITHLLHHTVLCLGLVISLLPPFLIHLLHLELGLLPFALHGRLSRSHHQVQDSVPLVRLVIKNCIDRIICCQLGKVIPLLIRVLPLPNRYMVKFNIEFHVLLQPVKIFWRQPWLTFDSDTHIHLHQDQKYLVVLYRLRIISLPQLYFTASGRPSMTKGN